MSKSLTDPNNNSPGSLKEAKNSPEKLDDSVITECPVDKVADGSAYSQENGRNSVKYSVTSSGVVKITDFLTVNGLETSAKLYLFVNFVGHWLVLWRSSCRICAGNGAHLTLIFCACPSFDHCLDGRPRQIVIRHSVAICRFGKCFQGCVYACKFSSASAVIGLLRFSTKTEICQEKKLEIC